MTTRSTLPEPRTNAGRAGLAALLREPLGTVLAFDFDGTLSPIVGDPAAARAHPGAVGALTRLAGRVDRVLVVTGRPAAQAVELGALASVPGLIVLGHYGLERWEDGQLVAPPPVPGVAAARAELPGLLRRHGEGSAASGPRIEDKGSSVAVHTRGAANPQGLLDSLTGPLTELAHRHGLVVEPGRLVLELRPPGVDKGGAIRAVAAERTPACVVFTGDDLGDLAAFDAVEALRAEGVPGLLVCSGSQEVRALAERADLVVDGPGGVVELVEQLAAELGG